MKTSKNINKKPLHLPVKLSCETITKHPLSKLISKVKKAVYWNTLSVSSLLTRQDSSATLPSIQPPPPPPFN